MGFLGALGLSVVVGGREVREESTSFAGWPSFHLQNLAFAGVFGAGHVFWAKVGWSIVSWPSRSSLASQKADQV